MTVVAGAKKVKDGLIFAVSASNKKSLSYGNNLINPGTWAVGTGSATGFSINGTTEENHRILGTDPFGNTNVVVWEARPEGIDASGADGGWNGSYFAIDNTKMYRFSVWVKRNSNADGRFYLGLNAAGTSNLLLNRTNITSTTTNPYFWTSITGFNIDEWELVVGHVWPAGTQTGSNHSDSGRYRVSSGRVGNISTDYVWHEGNTSSRHRAYLYYSANAAQRQQFVYPRVDLIDGTEPSIDDLLNNRVGKLADVSGNDNTGTMINTPTYDGEALVFDGVNSHVVIPNLNPPNFTFEVVFEGSSGYVARKFNYGWGLYFNSPSSLSAWVDTNTTHRQDTYAFSYSERVCIHMVFSNSTLKVYRNGEELTSIARTANSVYSTAPEFRLGSDSATTGMLNGKIYYAKLYDRGLSAEEIKKNFLAVRSRFGL